MILSLYERQRESRDVNDWLWGQWLDERTFPIDIGAWTVTAFTAAYDPIAEVKGLDGVEAAVAAMPNPGRNSPLRPVYAKVRKPTDRASLLIWAVAVALGIDPPASLYDRSQPIFDAVKKAGGLPKKERRPDRELRVERMSFVLLTGIVATASDGELGRARADCRRISAIARTAECVDWGAVDGTLSRHRRRQLKSQRISIPTTVSFLLARWRSSTFRAVLVPFLISVRRSPPHSRILSERLTIAERALALFPKIEPVQLEAAE
jgi:hypothetical protein